MTSNKNRPPLSKEEQKMEEIEAMKEVVKKAGFYYENMDLEELKTVAHQIKTNNVNEEKPLSPSTNKSKLKVNSCEPSESNSVEFTNNSSGRNGRNNEHTSAVSTPTENHETVHANSLKSELSLSNENKNVRNEKVSEQISNVKKDEVSEIGSKPKKDVSKERTKNSVKQYRRTPRLTKSERWRLNMNQFIGINDICPIELSAESPCNHQKDSYICKDEPNLDDAETFHQLCEQMNAQLDTLSEKYSIILEESEAKPQWGSLYKVANNWHDSLDTNAIVKKNQIHNNSNSDTPIRQSLDRATKRKALSSFSSATHDESSDENNDKEFIDIKKRKCLQNKKKEEVEKKDQETQSDIATPIVRVEMIDVDDSANLTDLELFDKSVTHNLDKSSSVKNSAETKPIIEDEIKYPRRVIPPNPSKMKNMRGRKKNVLHNQKSFLKQHSLNDEDLIKTINQLDEEIEIREHINIVNEIKPLPVPKKLQLASVHLEKSRIAQEQNLKSAEEIKKQKEKDDELKKNELISKRQKEEADEHNRKIEKEKKSNERKIFYNAKLNTPNQRITRSNFNKPKKTVDEMDEDDLLEADNDEPLITHDSLSIQNCPICEKPFSTDKIMSHASGCNEFPSKSDDFINQPSSSYSIRSQYHECHICNKYKTYDGNLYEEHVINCKRDAEDGRNGFYI